MRQLIVNVIHIPTDEEILIDGTDTSDSGGL